MLIGVITTRHVLAHPVILVREYGFRVLLVSLWYGLGPRPHTFLEILRRQ
jgi:hypothetical protein